MVILQQVLSFESAALDYFCSNMVLNPGWEFWQYFMPR
jgi:hypothetical protein